jgi:hypothetical protein
VDEGAGKASVLNGADERWCSGRKRESMANNRTPQALAVLRHGGTVEVCVARSAVRPSGRRSLAPADSQWPLVLKVRRPGRGCEPCSNVEWTLGSGTRARTWAFRNGPMAMQDSIPVRSIPAKTPSVSRPIGLQSTGCVAQERGTGAVASRLAHGYRPGHDRYGLDVLVVSLLKEGRAGVIRRHRTGEYFDLLIHTKVEFPLGK